MKHHWCKIKYSRKRGVAKEDLINTERTQAPMWFMLQQHIFHSDNIIPSSPPETEHFALSQDMLLVNITMQGLYLYFLMEQFTTSESFLHLEKTGVAHCYLAGNGELSLLPHFHL